MEMYMTETSEGGGQDEKIPSHSSEIPKHPKRMIVLRWRSCLPPPPFLYSALKCMLMSSNQGQILVLCFGEELGQETGALNPHTAICVRYEENNGISP